MNYTETTSAVGNAAAMREALVKTSQFLSKLGEWLKVNDEGQEYALAAGMIHTLVEHALAKPQRNCDMFGGDEVKIFDCYIQERKFCEYKHLFPDYGFWLLKTAKTEGGAS